jgi:hypothetical protein
MTNYATATPSFNDAMATAERMVEWVPGRIVGYGVAHLLDAAGNSKLAVPFANTITDTGDTYYATRGAAGVNSNGVSQPTLATGMQIGAGSTAVNKAAGTGITLGSYLYGQVFDATYPSVTAIGTNLGTQVTYKATYAAGNGTGAVTESTIVNGTVTTSALAASAILSRTVFAAITKGAADTLAITWSHKFLGA